MAIFRITASLDNTISDAYEENLTTRGTGSNMGASDILEVFTIYAQANSSSVEKSRALIQFPLDKITEKRTANILPASGSVSFFLNLYNAPHSSTVPTNFNLFISPVSQSWQEGKGLDMDNYTDLTYDRDGSNWINAASASTWITQGGDYLYSETVTASFTEGTEDLVIDVSDIVENWIKGLGGGKYNNYGFGIQLSTTHEADIKSFFTKKFFARNSEFYFKRPNLEARWDDSDLDDRGNFYFSSSLATGEQNLNKIYLYNKIRGKLTNIPNVGSGQLTASLYSDKSGTLLSHFDAGQVSTGIYTASVYLTGTQSTLYDVWSLNGTQYFTGSITPKTVNTEMTSDDSKYVISVTNNIYEYRKDQTARFRIYSRKKNWSPNLYTVAQKTPENLIIEDALYKVFRIVDGQDIINYSTSSTKYSKLSHDVSGNYFDLDMSIFETGYQYGFKVSFYDDYLNSYKEQPYIFKFKVVD
jgi:hypothetical protein